jgi:flagellar FliL protein
MVNMSLIKLCPFLIVAACLTCGCTSDSNDNQILYSESHLVENSDYAYLPEHRLLLDLEHPEENLHPVHLDLGGHGHDLIPLHISEDEHRQFCLEDSDSHLEVIFFDATGNELGHLGNEGDCLTPFSEHGVHYLEMHNSSHTHGDISVELYSVVSDLAKLNLAKPENKIVDTITITNIKVVGLKSATHGFSYYIIEPDIALNVVDPNSQPSAVRFQVVLMLISDTYTEAVEHFEPYLRSTVISIVGQESKNTLQSASGRSQIEQKCLRELNRTIKQEIGAPCFKDVFIKNVQFN